MSFPGNPQKMLQQAQAMQEQLKREIAAIRVEASTGGGMVTVRMDGDKKMLGIEIDRDALDDVEMLQDMVLGACNEAVKRVEEETQRRVGGMLGGLGLPAGLTG